MYRIILSIFLCCITHVSFSQENTSTVNTKKFDHYASVQVNQLIKEIINLSTNNPLIDNPYLLEYTWIYNKLNVGINAGFGYTYSQMTDHDNPDARLLEEDDLSFFIGICKRQMLGTKVELTYGLDYANNFILNKSYSYTVTDFGSGTDSTYFQVKDESKSHGGGFDVTLRYYLGKRILLGTQLTYYYMVTSEKTHSLTYSSTDFQTVTNSLEVTNQSSDHKDFALHLPIAIFLIFKF